MADNIDERLKETSDRCMKAYEDWKTKETDPSKREELREAIHELRKVSSRLEIEMAVSEREEMAQKPIPIPPHRAAKGKHGGRKDNYKQKGGEKKNSRHDKSKSNSDNQSNGKEKSINASVEKLKKSGQSSKDSSKDNPK